MNRCVLLAALLLSAALLGQDQTSSSSEAAPRKVRPLPAGAVPLKPAGKAPNQAAPQTPPAQTANPAGAARVRSTGRSRAPSRTPASSQGTTAEEDRAIEAVIKTKLAKSKIGLDGFTVRVQGGVAFWDGQTGVPQHKGAATRMAKTAGARRVVNNIRVSESAKQQAVANLQEGRRRDQAKRGEPRSQ